MQKARRVRCGTNETTQADDVTVMGHAPEGKGMVRKGDEGRQCPLPVETQGP